MVNDPFHGGGQILPGLEKELTRLKIGDRKKIRAKPEGYGLPHPKTFQEIPQEKKDPPAGQKVKAMLMTETFKSSKPNDSDVVCKHVVKHAAIFRSPLVLISAARGGVEADIVALVPFRPN